MNAAADEAKAHEAVAQAVAAASGMARLFADAGYRLYLVGGVVREALTGRFAVESDLDCTTDAIPVTVRRIVGPAASSLWTQGERFGTIGCVMDDRAFEITTHRAERYRRDSRKPAVAFGDDVTEDLARRDFTVNAMAVDTRDGRLLDPHGGRRDLAAGVLRTPLDPDISFGDDPLRMLRAARFISSHGLTPDRPVVVAVESMRERLSIVAAERIRDELEKLLMQPDPSRGLDFLIETGLLDQVLLDRALTDPVPPYRAAGRSVGIGRAVAAVAASPASRWAALLVWDSPDEAASRLRALRCSNELVSAVKGLLRARVLLTHGLTGGGADAVAVRMIVSACPVGIDEALDFARAVAPEVGESPGGLEAFADALAELRRHENVDNLELPIDGVAVMEILGLEPGPEVGRALAMLHRLTLTHGPLSESQAADALRRWWSQH